METIAFSVVITTLNEEKSIGALLESLRLQTLQPAEIIIVDAGSTDETTTIATKAGAVVIHEPGVNRSRGRNIGIEKAKSNYIAVTDAGCVADSHWLENLANGFQNDVDAVAGFYKPVIKKPIHHLFATYVATSTLDFDASAYLPSSRSLAFTKAAWETALRYPEELTTCEDLVFADRLKQNCTMAVRSDALVMWNQAENLSEYFKQIAGYARGDVQARYQPHLIKIISVWMRYLLFLFIPALGVVYLVYPLFKHRRLFGVTQWAWLLPVIQVVTDAAIMWGTTSSLRDTTRNL